MLKYYYAALPIIFFIFTNPVVGQDKDVTFDQRYIEKNDQQAAIEINEVQELTYVMFAITQFGSKDSGMVNRNTEYYKSVIDYFGPVYRPSLNPVDGFVT